MDTNLSDDMLDGTDLDMADDMSTEASSFVENDDGSVDIFNIAGQAVEVGAFDANLAETLDRQELDKLASRLLEDIDRDITSREKRDEQYAEGLQRTGLGNDAPGGATFSGASTVVHPVLAEACVDFAARAIKELFPPQGPVKTAIVGNSNDEAVERAERKRTYLNYQLTTQMPEYRSELEQLLTQLPLGGSQFQKFWYDERFARPTSEFVPIDDLHIPYSAKSFYTAQRVTHVQRLTKFEFDQRVDSGLYVDLELDSAPPSAPEQSATAEANDLIEGKEADCYNEDGLRNVYEVYCWENIKDPLVDAVVPYIITIDEHSEKILAIYRNWAEDDESFEKLDWLVEWKFIPWRGAYAIGFPQLIGSLSGAATGALRALLDSAHINNTPALVKLAGGGRMVGQNVQVDATGISEIQGPAGVDDIRKLMMALPYNQPSGILFQLLAWLTDAAKGVVKTAEGSIANAGDRTPVGTTQAMIEQGSVIYSAIHARLHESQKRALQILCRINKTWLNEETTIEDLGKLVIRRDDFTGSLDVIPVSDPAIFSEAQRYAQNQSIIQMAQADAQDPSVPWNKVAIRRRVLKQLRIDNVDELLPLPTKPITADPMTENMASLGGGQVVANLQQDHMSHIQGHMTFIMSPLQLNNTFIPPQVLLGLLNHTQQHMNMLLQQTTASIAVQVQGTNPGISQDKAVAIALQQATQMLTEQFTQLAQVMQQAQGVLQQRTPPPQMPPEVQASIEIAKMDIERKKALDGATLQAKAQQQQASQQLEQMQLVMDQRQQQFDRHIEQMRVQLESQNNQLTAQVDLLNNKSDNTQKQMTDLLKNRDDNQTNLLIAQMKNAMSEMQAQQTPAEPSAPQVDLTPQLQALQQTLDRIGQDKTHEALGSVIQGLQATVQHLSRGAN